MKKAKAQGLFHKAKTSKTEREILELCAKAYELCTDLPGIKELMPAPKRVTGFKADVNPTAKTNIISVPNWSWRPW